MQRELIKTGCKYEWLWGTKNLRVLQSDDLANEPNYQHIPPSSVDCWMIYFYHHHSAHRRGWCFLVEGWTQWWHPLCCCCCFVVNGHQPSRLQIDLQQLQPLLCYTLATRCWLHLQLRRWMQLRRLEMLPGLCRRRQRYVMVDRNFSRARGVSWKWPWLSRHRGKCYFDTGICSFFGTAE